VAIRRLPVEADDQRLVHKTTDRRFYVEARKESGAFVVLFTDADEFLTEGSFTTLFVEQDGLLSTPPLGRGVLPGILRAKLVEEGKAVERDLRVEDLADGFFVGNVVRGLLPATLA
jgi:para-aminobenzoate synthetase/4-amino-4-deoxychorismate lyase